MKQYLVLMSMVVLGIYMFNIIAGPGDHSMGKALQQMWQEGVKIRTYIP